MTNEYKIEHFPSLSLNHVHIKDKAAVIQKINQILCDGSNKLQVVTDFDFTLTKQHINGTRTLSSFALFSKCKHLPRTYPEEDKRLQRKYRPIEVNPDLPLDVKIAAMEQWMYDTENLIKGVELKAEELNDVIETNKAVLRDGTIQLFDKLNSLSVPILVFSGGLGDVVEAVLTHHNILLKNVKVISNFLKFNNSIIEGFKNSILIHAFNKNEHSLESSYLKNLKDRRNVILMGDTTGDVHMADGLDDAQTILRIGFLYDDVELCLEAYKNIYDIVLVDDQTMQVTLEILQPIL
ncbi:7-methylguanosine phosphate-specific 5'-nucleotidase [Prorops nasuta]|uniref:7-methylguanosine phosphate-specific 5'-nucleotidase n=1 Tax=Prorops nasuta TaxID=863751 RepID=UPI0034CDE8AF